MLSLRDIVPHLLEGLSEAQIANCLKDLSDTFTKSRNEIEKIYKSRKHISAYASFYLPTNMYKMNFLLTQLNQEIIDKIKNSAVVEIGTGPGTYLFSLLESLNCTQTSFYGVDHNEIMLAQAKKLHMGIYPEASITWSSDIPKIKGEKTFIFGNSLNEMGHRTALGLVKKNQCEIVICIEPGTKQSFSEVSKFREGMLKEKYNVIYPCSGNFPCPILLKKDDWCHQVIRTKLDNSIERISQKVKLDRKTMPAIIHVYSKTLSSCKSARIIRLVKNIKHSFLWEVCMIEDDKLINIRLEVSKKQFDKKEIKALDKISSGIEIQFDVEKRLDDGTVRAKNVKVL